MKSNKLVMVPVEPTAEMVEAAFAGKLEPQCVQSQMKAREKMAKDYRSMLAAAPQAPAAPVTRSDIIDALLSTRSQSEGVAADAILSLLNTSAAPDVWKQAVDNVAGYVHLYSSGYGVIHEIRAEHVRLTAAHQPRETSHDE